MKELEKIKLVTSFNPSFVKDLDAVKTAFDKWLSLSKLETLVVVTEGNYTELTDKDDFFNNPRIAFVASDVRPTFDDLLRNVNELMEDGCVCGIANADVALESDEDLERISRVFDSVPNVAACVCLTRYDLDEKTSDYTISLEDNRGLPNMITADAWFFNSPVKLVIDCFYSLGHMNCDMFFAYDLHISGYYLVNPCVDIRLLHYETDVKDNTYYEELNLQNAVKDMYTRHMVSRTRYPGGYVCVPRVSSVSVQNGYLPLPIHFFDSKSIYITLPEDIKLLRNVLRVMEALSHKLGLDVFVITADFDLAAELTDIIDLDNCTRLYFLNVKNVDEVIERSIKDPTVWSNGDNAVLVNSVNMLSKELLEFTNTIFLDLRRMVENDIFSNDLEKGINYKVHSYMMYLYGEEGVSDYDDLFIDKDDPFCTLITSLYDGDKYIEGFFNNISSSVCYELMEHIVTYSCITENENKELLNRFKAAGDLVLIWFKEDPGLYECWNMSIELSRSNYISNANIDDFRDKEHVKKLVNELDNRNHVQFAASALYPFEEYFPDPGKLREREAWYMDCGSLIEFGSLARVKNIGNKLEVLPHNIPHCMPVWRRSLHNDCGYFDEKNYGTFADWEFWLRVTSKGYKGFLLKEPLGFYYINQDSHNRRGDKLRAYHDRIVEKYRHEFLIKNEVSSALPGKSKKLRLEGVDHFYGHHRNAFGELIKSLLPLHSNDAKIRFIPFIERYFSWGAKEGEAASGQPVPITDDWVGVLHVPFDSPVWFNRNNHPESIFETKLWRDSMPTCRGLIVLSGDLKRDLRYVYPHLPVLSVKHPTELESVKYFDKEKYVQDKKVVQVGDWLRKLQVIYEIEGGSHRKIMLYKAYTRIYLEQEITRFGDKRNKTVEEMDAVSNEEYDALLSSSVVLCMLYATAANNVIIECIARNTPIIINPLPSVIEYLGEEYPLYATTVDDINNILNDDKLIIQANEYLASKEELTSSLSYGNFLKNIETSEFYSNL